MVAIIKKNSFYKVILGKTYAIKLISLQFTICVFSFFILQQNGPVQQEKIHMNDINI